MDELLKGFLIALIPALIVAVISSFLSVKLSLKNFYSQRWWDRKAEAYSEIMLQLSRLYHCFYELYLEITLGLPISKTKKNDLIKDYRIARENLEKAVAVGSFIVSEQAVSDLEKMMIELIGCDQKTDHVDFVNHAYDVVSICIGKIRAEANKELKG